MSRNFSPQRTGLLLQARILFHSFSTLSKKCSQLIISSCNVGFVGLTCSPNANMTNDIIVSCYEETYWDVYIQWYVLILSLVPKPVSILRVYYVGLSTTKLFYTMKQSSKVHISLSECNSKIRIDSFQQIQF